MVFRRPRQRVEAPRGGPSPNEPAPVPCRPFGTRIRPQPWPKAEEAFVEELRIHLPATLWSVA